MFEEVHTTYIFYRETSKHAKLLVLSSLTKQHSKDTLSYNYHVLNSS